MSETTRRYEVLFADLSEEGILCMEGRSPLESGKQYQYTPHGILPTDSDIRSRIIDHPQTAAGCLVAGYLFDGLIETRVFSEEELPFVSTLIRCLGAIQHLKNMLLSENLTAEERFEIETEIVRRRIVLPELLERLRIDPLKLEEKFDIKNVSLLTRQGLNLILGSARNDQSTDTLDINFSEVLEAMRKATAKIAAEILTVVKGETYLDDSRSQTLYKQYIQQFEV